MKFRIQSISKLIFAVCLSITFVSIMSCVDDSTLADDITLTGQSKTYTLAPVSNSGISGTIQFLERKDHSTIVTIDLDGTGSGNNHPADFYANSVVETGTRLIALNPVNGTTGKSETVVTHKDDGSVITYDQLLTLNAHVSVYSSETEAMRPLTQVDIGSNEITNTHKSYTLHSVNDSNITGAVRFSKRASGTTLVMVNLEGVSATANYPVYLSNNDSDAGGTAVLRLNPVLGGEGISYTNVTRLIDGSSITYDQLVGFNGHISVVTSEAVQNFIARSDIGSN